MVGLKGANDVSRHDVHPPCLNRTMVGLKELFEYLGIFQDLLFESYYGRIESEFVRYLLAAVFVFESYYGRIER